MTRVEQDHLNAVASLGCIVCRLKLGVYSPAHIHHIRTGQGRKRATHFETIPLCPPHHQTGGYGVAFHAGRKAFESNFGSELELLATTRRLLDKIQGVKA